MFLSSDVDLLLLAAAARSPVGFLFPLSIPDDRKLEYQDIKCTVNTAGSILQQKNNTLM